MSKVSQSWKLHCPSSHKQSDPNRTLLVPQVVGVVVNPEVQQWDSKNRTSGHRNYGQRCIYDLPTTWRLENRPTVRPLSLYRFPLHLSCSLITNIALLCLKGSLGVEDRVTGLDSKPWSIDVLSDPFSQRGLFYSEQSLLPPYLYHILTLMISNSHF